MEPGHRGDRAMSDAASRILPGESRFADGVAPLIYDSVHELMNFMYGSRSVAEAVIRRLMRWPGGHFGYRFATVMVDGRDVVGVELGYDKARLSAQDLPGAINMLRATPIGRWWHLIGTVGPVVSSYVPPPAGDAYYINNIDTATTTGTKSFGRRRILETS